MGATTEESISFVAVQSHCEANGWTVKIKDELALFLSPQDSKGSKLRYVINTAPVLNSMRADVSALIRGIGEIEGLGFNSVLETLQLASSEPEKLEQHALRLRVFAKTPNADVASLRFSEMEDVLSRLKGVLSYSLSSEVSDPQPWRQKPSKKASALVSAFEFAHTQKGSFVMNVRAPSYLYMQAALVTRPPAAEEKCLSRISVGLDWIQKTNVQSVSDLSTSILKSGLNANMAEQLVELSQSLANYEMELCFSFPSKVTETTARPGPFRIDGNLRGNLRRYIDLLTSAQVFTGTLKAKVVRLGSSGNQTDLIQQVTFETIDMPEVNALFCERKIKHMLAGNEFQKAYEYQQSGALIGMQGRFEYSKGVVKALECTVLW